MTNRIIFDRITLACHGSEQRNYRGMEQLAARRAHNPKVVGSNPTPATKKSSRLKTIRFQTVFSFIPAAAVSIDSRTLPTDAPRTAAGGIP